MMTLAASDIVHAFKTSLLTPRQGARIILAQRIGLTESWMLLALAAVLSGLFGELVLQLALPAVAVQPDPSSVDAIVRQVAASPLRFTLFQFLLMGAGAILTFRLGRAAGGTGDMEQSLVLISWLQILVLVLQAAILVLVIAVPMVGAVLSLLVPVMTARILTLFVTELHGFKSPWLVWKK